MKQIHVMKYLIASFIVALGFVGLAHAATYQSIYCYSTGSYWQAQLAAYPDYYAAHDAYYRAHYGPTTFYCTG